MRLCNRLAIPLVVVCLASPASAWAAPASKAVLDVAVELDQPGDKALADQIRGGMVKALNAEGVAVTKAADAHTGTIVIKVGWNADDNHAIDVLVQTAEGDKAVTGSPFVCDTCKDAQVVETVLAAAPAMIEQLPETPDDGPSGDGDGDGGDDGGSGQPRDGQTQPLGRLGKAGIGLMVGGAAVLVGGAVLTAMGEKEDSAPGNPQRLDAKDFRPPGYALLGVGGAVLVTGVLLLAVDRIKAKPKKTTFAPSLAPGFAGATIRVHF